MLPFRSLDPFRPLREPDRRRRDEERLSPPNKEPPTNQKDHLTGKAPYRFESGSLQQRVGRTLPPFRCEQRDPKPFEVGDRDPGSRFGKPLRIIPSEAAWRARYDRYPAVPLAHRSFPRFVARFGTRPHPPLGSYRSFDLTLGRPDWASAPPVPSDNCPCRRYDNCEQGQSRSGCQILTCNVGEICDGGR